MLHKNLAKFRKAKKMTQKQVADKLHITPQAYSRYERNDERSAEPSAENLKILADLYDVTVDALLGKSENDRSIDSLFFNHLEGFSDLSEEEQKRIEQSLIEQAEFLIAKAKKNK